MLFSYLSSDLSYNEIIISVIITVPIILFSLSFHEFAHAFVAYKMGDPTARNLGRLTIDPLKHIDIIGALMMLLIGIGWAKPVPVNSRYFKNPKIGMAITALAGPIMNLFISFIFHFIYILLTYLNVFNGSFYSGFTSNLLFIIEQIFVNTLYLNCFLAVFNLIPIPPFDGSRIAFVLIPTKWYFGIMKYERWIMIVLIILLWSGILTTPLSYLTNMILSFNTFLISSFLSLFF